ncbi:glucanase [Kineosporia sp. NBRC 101677]|uniref:glycoside hydrolase family 6 protein n=1 Tax=Kineosporia sp. NBRC 101677 TaxID=3032197 RepID=UPI0024A4BA21|nr:glycoside hydrolase family 6 protein [Kineosporia sp. NBRC 101677]GLY20075.1 glucanase [Kineosporia sp. NBRC 101677]
MTRTHLTAAVAAGLLTAVGLTTVVVTQSATAAPAASLVAAKAVAAGPIGTLNLAASSGFYVDPKSQSALWTAANPGDSRMPVIREGLAKNPMARWFGDWFTSISKSVGDYVDASEKAGKVPILVAYSIPNRDACSGYSGGGETSAAKYRTWISSYAGAIMDRPAVVVLEPDALADYSCLDSSQKAERENLIRYATEQFRDKAPNAAVYIDAGNSKYAKATDIADRLAKAGVDNVRGFALNVSNFHTESEETAFGDAVNMALAAQGKSEKPYVMDTSRNGNGWNGQWCNPVGRKIGVTSRVDSTDGTSLEARLWIKTAGNSDGECGNAPTSKAGTFNPQIAYDMVLGNQSGARTL